MKGLLFSLVILSVSAFAGETSIPASLKFNKDFSITKLSTYETEYYAEGNFEKDSKCVLGIRTPKPVVIKKGTVIKGLIIGEFDREVSSDSDTIGKSGSSQYSFSSDDKFYQVNVSCFTSGRLLFPRAGLKTLKEVYKLSEEYFTVSK